ncbi:MAG: hypothetical protein ACRCX2_17935 [Paraclostridium sp.]
METKKLILTNIWKDKDFYCEINRHLDSLLKNQHLLEYHIEGYTYFYDAVEYPKKDFLGLNNPLVNLGVDKPSPKELANIPLRQPGSTIGHLVVDKTGIIKDLILYKDSIEIFYEKELNLTQFIGRQISYNIITEKKEGEA